MVDAAQAARPHKIDGKVVEPKRAVPRNVRTSHCFSSMFKITLFIQFVLRMADKYS